MLSYMKSAGALSLATMPPTFAAEKPAYVFLAAAKVGGIVANESAPADFMYEIGRAHV